MSLTEETRIHIEVMDRLRSWVKQIETAMESLPYDTFALYGQLAALREDLKWIYHPANGELRDVKTANTLRAMGVVKGILDLCVPAPKGEYHGARVEIKEPKGTPTDEQVDFMAYCKAKGIKVFCSYSVCEIEGFILNYLCPRSMNVQKVSPIAMSPITKVQHSYQLVMNRSVHRMAWVGHPRLADGIDKGANVISTITGK